MGVGRKIRKGEGWEREETEEDSGQWERKDECIYDGRRQIDEDGKSDNTGCIVQSTHLIIPLKFSGRILFPSSILEKCFSYKFIFTVPVQCREVTI